mmetsp:Transcript_18029/g.36335  ORF Transcript_18029/g.36335 Transcript_18029/m.36335 type:complete len:161 (+) Transcript_18029:143-625(+)
MHLIVGLTADATTLVLADHVRDLGPEVSQRAYWRAAQSIYQAQPASLSGQLLCGTLALARAALAASFRLKSNAPASSMTASAGAAGTIDVLCTAVSPPCVSVGHGRGLKARASRRQEWSPRRQRWRQMRAQIAAAMAKVMAAAVDSARSSDVGISSSTSK